MQDRGPEERGLFLDNRLVFICYSNIRYGDNECSIYGESLGPGNFVHVLLLVLDQENLQSHTVIVLHSYIEPLMKYASNMR